MSRPSLVKKGRKCKMLQSMVIPIPPRRESGSEKGFSQVSGWPGTDHFSGQRHVVLTSHQQVHNPAHGGGSEQGHHLLLALPVQVHSADLCTHTHTHTESEAEPKPKSSLNTTTWPPRNLSANKPLSKLRRNETRVISLPQSEHQLIFLSA